MQNSATNPMQQSSGKPIRVGLQRRLNRVGTAHRKPKAEPTTLAERMVQRRLELKFTQAQVAAEVRLQAKSGPQSSKLRPLSRNAYAMYETGKTEPKLKQIEQIAVALGVTAGWLGFGETCKPEESDVPITPIPPISTTLTLSRLGSSRGK